MIADFSESELSSLSSEDLEDNILKLAGDGVLPTHIGRGMVSAGISFDNFIQGHDLDFERMRLCLDR